MNELLIKEIKKMATSSGLKFDIQSSEAERLRFLPGSGEIVIDFDRSERGNMQASVRYVSYLGQGYRFDKLVRFECLASTFIEISKLVKLGMDCEKFENSAMKILGNDRFRFSKAI